MTRTYHDFFSLFRQWSKQEDLWDVLKRNHLPIYIYGMGNGADRLAERLHLLGVSESGYFASDGFVRGQFFRGHKVQSFSEVAEREGNFIALLAFGSRLPQVIDGFRAMQESVSFFVPDLPLIGEDFFDRAFLSEHTEPLAEACFTLSDAASRDLFCDLVQYKLTGDLSVLMRAVNSHAPSFRLGDREAIVDLGAYNGDSISAFRMAYPQISDYIAVEADERNFRKLEKYAENSKADDVSILAYLGAAGAEEGSTAFFSSGNRNSSKTNPSHQKKAVSVPVITVDRICNERSVGLIKFDVEGMEGEALLGAMATVARCRPVLKLSVYHRSEDLYRLLLLCKERYPNTFYYLRRSSCVPAWEVDLYVIPEERRTTKCPSC